jgi:hypothetical protein
VHETSSKIIGYIHRKGCMVSAQHFANSKLEEVKETFVRIRETRTCENITADDHFEKITAVDHSKKYHSR